MVLVLILVRILGHRGSRLACERLDPRQNGSPRVRFGSRTSAQRSPRAPHLVVGIISFRLTRRTHMEIIVLVDDRMLGTPDSGVPGLSNLGFGCHRDDGRWR